jgi:hypothetical protein
MVSPTQHGRRGVLLTAQSGHKWKDRLTSVCLPDPQFAVKILRSSWTVAGRSKAERVIPSIGERYADGQD